VRLRPTRWEPIVSLLTARCAADDLERDAGLPTEGLEGRVKLRSHGIVERVLAVDRAQESGEDLPRKRRRQFVYEGLALGW